MLSWKVWMQNFNAKKIEEYDIFKHTGFVEDCKKYKNDYKDKEHFTEAVRRSLLYYFWCKCEYEVVISAWPPREDVDKKVDVYRQVMLNWPVFSEYIWENRKELK